MKKTKEKFMIKKPQFTLEKSRRQTKHGSYSMGMIAMVIAGAIAVNLIVQEIPSKYTEFDVSSQQLASLTQDSKDILSGLTKDMTIYLIAQDGQEDSTIQRLLDNYAEESSHIKVETIDPVKYPKFTSTYTSDDVSSNSVIVVCGDQSRVIDYYDLYETSYSYYSYSADTTGFDGEGQITSAIAAFESDSESMLYTLSGHGESDLSSDLKSEVEKANISVDSLNLMSDAEIPEDADLLLLTMPSSDFTDAETEKILTYLKEGGRAAIITDYTETEMPNLQKILNYVGVSLESGLVLEGDSNHYVQAPYYILPEISSSDITGGLSGGSAYVILGACQGLTTLDSSESGLSVTPVLTTTDQSYAKAHASAMTTYEKEDGDTDGPFDIGVIASGTIADETADGETAAEETADGETAVEETADGETAVEETADGETAAEETADGETAAEETADGETAAEETADGETAAEETADDETTAAESADAETTAEAEEETARETRVAIFTSGMLLDSSANQMVSGGNYTLMTNTLSWLCDKDSAVSIPVKSMSVTYLTVPDASAALWGTLVIALIPGLFLFGGLIVWNRRRKK